MLGAGSGSSQPALTITAMHHLAERLPRSGFVHGRRADPVSTFSLSVDLFSSPGLASDKVLEIELREDDLLHLRVEIAELVQPTVDMAVA